MNESTSAAAAAAVQYPQLIGNRVVAFKDRCDKAALLQLEIANSAREIGLLAQSWCGSHEKLTVTFFQNHKAQLPPEATYQLLRTCTSIARRYPQPLENVQATRRLWQPTFQAVGFFEPARRTDRQHAATTTPFVKLVNAIGKVRTLLCDWATLQPYGTWDHDLKSAVRSQLRPLVELYNALGAVPPH